MPPLTRRRNDDPRREGWIVLFGDVEVGRIGPRAGVPPNADQWGWLCGFYPGCEPGEHKSGSAPDFLTARCDFESAWRVLSSKRTEEDYQAWRDQRDWTARKYAMFERGQKMLPSSLMRCVCGVTFDSHKPDESGPHREHIYAAQAERVR
jgi:hypothetical protein